MQARAVLYRLREDLIERRTAAQPALWVCKTTAREAFKATAREAFKKLYNSLYRLP